MGACVVLTTAGKKDADRLAKLLVSQKLAACVTCVPGAVSRYRWKGKTEVARETLLWIKTARRLWPKVLRFLKSHHPYDLPEILLLPSAGGSKEYLRWIESSLQK